MRQIRHYLGVLFVISLAGPTAVAQAQAPATAAKPAPPKKPPSKLKSLVGKVVDSAATVAAGMAADSLLGTKGGSVASALGAGAHPCVGGAYPGMAGASPVSAGIAAVGMARKALQKKKADSTAAPPANGAPCAAAAQLSAAAAAAAAVGMPASPGGAPGAPSAMGMMAAMTPVGMAVAAAPLAGAAAKGIKGMFGGKPQDKMAMLRELGKGKLELKSVKFIEGTAELEPGYEASFTAFGEAIALAEGTYILYIAAEAGDKGTAPDTALARKRTEKVWAAILVSGVADQKVVAMTVLPPELSEGRKPPKQGSARIEFIRQPAKP